MISKLIYLMMGLLVMWGCSSSEVDESKTAEGAYKTAETYFAAQRYEEAIAKYSEVKNKHPYSKYAVESKLKIADAYFKKEEFIEAQHSYQLFKEFHPKHPRIDYVTYQLALCFFNQLPSVVSRDLTVANNAIIYFDEIITSYPESEFVKDSKEKKRASQKMLGEKILYIADWYFGQKTYESALGRYQQLLDEYPQVGLDPRALLGAVRCSIRLGDKEKASQYFEQLKEKHTKSSETKSAQSEMSQNGYR